MFGKKAKSGNPLMRAAQRQATQGERLEVLEAGIEHVDERAMTVGGAINKTFMLLFLMLVTAAIGFSIPGPLTMWGGAIGGIAMVVLGSYKPQYAKYAAPAYALFEGLFVGAVSAIYAYMFDGIILQAVSLTIAVLLMMLFLYQARIIKVTQKLRAGVMMATGAVLLVYVVNFALSFFGINVPFLHEGGAIGIGISLVIIGIAAFNLLLDFDNFEKGAAANLPERYEWVFSMGLLVTIVWIYVEILRLLSVLASE